MDERWLGLRAQVNETFTPGSPVRDRELFAGRTKQVLRLTDAAAAPGEHVAIYGERGVGKTSLAAYSEMIAGVQGALPGRVNCNSDDDFSRLVAKFPEALYRGRRYRPDNDELVEQVLDTVMAMLGGTADRTVSDVLDALEVAGGMVPLVLFLDEFDRIKDPAVVRSLVDLMKAVSDYGTRATIVVVGVASSVEELIAEHASIGRGLVQIRMPRMHKDELEDLLERGLNHIDMEMAPPVKTAIVSLSLGLPHYTHLRARESCLAAIGESSREVDPSHLLLGMDAATRRGEEHIERLFHSATRSTQKNILKEVLVACALTPTDELGSFAPGDVREPLTLIMNKKYEIPAFARHLKAFSEDRGPIFDRTSPPRPRYSFREPMLVPYAILRGIREGIVPMDDAVKLVNDRLVK